MSEPNAPRPNAPPHPDSPPTQDERREAALAICDLLEYFLEDGRERGGHLVDYSLDGGLRKYIEDLQRTYPPSLQLPGGGQQFWRQVEALLDPDLVGGRSVGWQEFSTAIDNFLAWLRCHYALGEFATGHDPGEWDRRIQFDQPSWTIRLNGTSYRMPSPAHFRLVRRLVAAAKCGVPWVKQSVLAKDAHDEDADAKNVQRLLSDEDFPAIFRQMIGATPGRGTFIRLPPPE